MNHEVSTTYIDVEPFEMVNKVMPNEDNNSAYILMPPVLVKDETRDTFSYHPQSLNVDMYFDRKKLRERKENNEKHGFPKGEDCSS